MFWFMRETPKRRRKRKRREEEERRKRRQADDAWFWFLVIEFFRRMYADAHRRWHEPYLMPVRDGGLSLIERKPDPYRACIHDHAKARQQQSGRRSSLSLAIASLRYVRVRLGEDGVPKTNFGEALPPSVLAWLNAINLRDALDLLILTPMRLARQMAQIQEEGEAIIRELPELGAVWSDVPYALPMSEEDEEEHDDLNDDPDDKPKGGRKP